MTGDERRALAFIAAVLCLSAAVRLVGLPEPVAPPGEGGFDLASHIEAVERAVEERQAAERPLEPGETIDPNTATAEELTRLPRVGPALAGRIVADREANGRYRRLGDLTRVSGVGERMLEALAPHMALPAGPAVPSAGRSTGLRAGSRLARSRAGLGDVRDVGEARGPAEPVDLNRADAEALTGLPGIGPVLAERIVAYRDSAGPFRTLAELARVKGIGPATTSRIADRVVVR